MLAKAKWLIDGMRVYPERMRRNLESTRGLIFSGQLLLDLAAAGMLREEAYKVVQAHAMESWENEGDFRAVVGNDPKILSFLSVEEIQRAFSVERQLTNVDRIFARVFQKH
jgi:adenylosuccinate lyase